MAKYKPFPEFEKIGPKELKRMPLSIILQAGSNWLTKWGEHKMGWIYDTTFTHAMIHIINGNILSMGRNAKVYTIDEIYKKSHKFIVISFRDMSEGVRNKGIDIAWNRAASDEYQMRFYDIRGYLGFLPRIFKPLRKVKFLKGSNKLEFCSDQCVNVISEAGYPPFIDLDGNDYSPCDIFSPLCSNLEGAYFNELVA